jgi:hypothetical protein
VAVELAAVGIGLTSGLLQLPAVECQGIVAAFQDLNQTLTNDIQIGGKSLSLTYATPQVLHCKHGNRGAVLKNTGSVVIVALCSLSSTSLDAPEFESAPSGGLACISRYEVAVNALAEALEDTSL